MGEVEDFEPVLPGTAASDYERYLRTDELLALQKAPDELTYRDELLFMTVHQSSELWLKLAAFEVDTAVELIRGGDLAGALRLLRRAHDCLRNTTAALDMLEHMSPWEYTAFVRPLLGKLIHNRLYPELWDARNELTEIAKQEEW